MVTPVQPQASSAAAVGSSLFAGLSVKDNNETKSVPSHLITSSRPSENTINVNVNKGFPLPQPPALVSHNQPMANVSRAPSNAFYQPTSSASVMQNQPVSTTSEPILSATVTTAQLPSSALLQPQPSSYNNSSSSYQPPPIVNSNILQPNTKPVVGANIPSEAPPPYAGHNQYSAVTSDFRTGTQQATLMPSMNPTINQTNTMHGITSASVLSTASNIPSHFRTDTLQPQPNMLQSTQPTVKPSSTVNSNMRSVSMHQSANNPPAFGTEILQPSVLGSTQPVAKPQLIGTGNLLSSVGTSTHMATSSPLHMQGVPTQGTGNTIDPRTHSNTVLLPQKTSMVSTPAGISYRGDTGTMNAASAATSGLFQQPLIAAPPVAQKSEGTRYRMSPGANPFSDINDLL